MATATETTSARPAGLAALDKLVGTWKVSGEAQGETTYEWMAGGHFLLQTGVFERAGTRYAYRGVIGYDRQPGASPAEAITERIYTSSGETLDYTSEIGERTLTVWFGPKGSPSVYRGEFSDDGSTLRGEWVWPGGGYIEIMTRVDR